MNAPKLALPPMGSPCAECGSRVTWETTRSGERIPCDVQPTANGKYELRDGKLVVVAEGQQLRLGDKPGERFNDHRETCTERKEWSYSDDWAGKPLADAPLVVLIDYGSALQVAIDKSDNKSRTDGEVTPEAEAEFAELAGSLEAKVEGYGAVCAQLEAEAEATVQLSQRYAERAQIKLNATRRLKDRLMEEMTRLGTTVVATPTVKARIQNSAPSVKLLVADALVPNQFCVVVRSVSKTALKVALADRDPDALKVAEIVTNTHLRFR